MKRVAKSGLKPVMITAMVAATLGTGAVSWAGELRNLPKGKPFVDIAGQLIEVDNAITGLQDQIDALVGAVDGLEAQLAATQEAILSLEATNDLLHMLIAQNATDIDSINAELTMLQTENAALQADIDAASGDIATLQSDLAANDATIVSLQAALVAVENGAIALHTDLQSQIDHNAALIAAMRSQVDSIEATLAFKQTLVSGSCPDGAAMAQINADGSVVCTPTGVSPGSLLRVEVTSAERMLATNSVGASNVAACPAGHVLTGAGFAGDFRTTFFWTETVSGGTGVRVYGWNRNSAPAPIWAIAHCLRLVQ